MLKLACGGLSVDQPDPRGGAGSGVKTHERRKPRLVIKSHSFQEGFPQRELVDVKGVIQEMITLLRGEASRLLNFVHEELMEGLPKTRQYRVALQQV